MGIDADPFPVATVGMVDAHLPRAKGKGKPKFVSKRHVPKKNSQPRLKIDLFSNHHPKIQSDQPSSNPCQVLVPKKLMDLQPCVVGTRQTFRSNQENGRGRQKHHMGPQARWHLKKSLARVHVIQSSTGSVRRTSSHLQQDDASTSKHHSTMKTIMPAIPAARALLQIRKPSNPLKHEISFGIPITRLKACTLHCPNHKSVGAKE